MATAASGSSLSSLAVAAAPGFRQEATSPAASSTGSADAARASGACRAATSRRVTTSSEEAMAVTRRDNTAPADGGWAGSRGRLPRERAESLLFAVGSRSVHNPGPNGGGLLHWRPRMELVLDEAGVRPAVSVERRRPGRGWLPVALAAVGHLRTGHGFADIGGEPLTLFPPLFPAAVAALEWLGLAGLSAARFLNAAMFGVLVVLAGVWARRISGSDTVAAVVAGVTAISTPMVSMASWALSEPVGIVAEVACLMLLTEALRGTAGARPATGWAATGRAATGWAAAAGLAA